MQKTKADFINDMLKDKRLDLPLKEKFIELASKELLNAENENRKRIEELEKRIKSTNNLKDSNIIINNQRVHKEKNTFIPPNPQHTKNFLSYFRDSEGLKYLTHDYPNIATKIPRDKLLATARNEFEEAKSKYPQASSKLIRRVEEFAFKDSPNWSIRKGATEEFIRYGWSCLEFIEWENKSAVHPCRDAFWDKKMIEPFKKTIEIRDGLLLEVVEENIELIFSKDDLEVFSISYDKTNLLSGRFFTDVDWFGQAIYKILNVIKDKANKNHYYTITITYEEPFEENFKCLKIIHHDSKPNAPSNRNFNEGGNFKDIIKDLWSLCNWAIEAEFTDGFKRKYLLWDSNIKNTNIEIPADSVKGFTNLLIFY
ncbi:hypothetical protein [Runella zeae]|uniref:hypothetical protein n=1 Tax=Runella zeae TaxID=94255 RepID=UPI00235600AF|nr:hypothetical protein [Runella zeae]